jgi:YD repeat-containing protein
MSRFKKRFRSRTGRSLVGASLAIFVVSLVIGPGPAQAAGESLADGIQAYHGTSRSLTRAEMKSIVGASSLGTPDPWEQADTNTGGLGTANVITGNELLSIPTASYQGRGLSVAFVLHWNSGDAPPNPFSRTTGDSNPNGLGFTNSYNLYASVNATTGNVTIFEADGKTRLYTFSAGAYVPPAGIHDSLVKNLDGSYTLTRKNQVAYHFSATYSDSTYGLHLDTITDTHGNKITIAYSSFTINKVGGGTVSVYEATTITDPTGRVLTLAHDTNSRISTITDPFSRVWTLTYNSSGELTQVSTPRVLSGVHTVYNLGYNSNLQVSSVQDRRGHTWTLAYGSNTSYQYNPLSSVTDPYSHVRAYGYGGPGAVSSVLDENNNEVSYVADGSGRVTGLRVYFISPSGPYTTVGTDTWDTSNNRLTHEDGNSNTWTYTWDAQGNKLTAEAPDTTTTTWTYDSRNNCTSIQSPLGYTTTLTYDSHNNLTNVQDALLHNTVYAYDGTHGDEMTSLTDAKSHAETIGYNANGLVNSITDADSHQTKYAWDSVSRLTQRTDARTNITNYTVDADGNTTLVSYPNSTTVSQTFDANDNKTAMTDSHGNWGFTFDNIDRLTATSDPSSRTTGITYDAGSRRTQLTRQDTTTVTYGYDGGNRLNSLTDSAISATATTLPLCQHELGQGTTVESV